MSEMKLGGAAVQDVGLRLLGGIRRTNHLIGVAAPILKPPRL